MNHAEESFTRLVAQGQPMASHPVEEFVADLVARFRIRAAEADELGFRDQADQLTALSVWVAKFADRWADQPLTLNEAAAISGLSYSTLQRMVAQGQLTNAGETGRPRVRRGDLPWKVQQGPDPEAPVARAEALNISPGSDLILDLVAEELLALEFESHEPDLDGLVTRTPSQDPTRTDDAHLMASGSEPDAK